MKVLMVLLALGAAAAVSGEHHGHCSPMQRLKVMEQWHGVYGTGHTRLDAGRVVWRAMFAKEPHSVELFKRVHGDDVYSPEFGAHSIRVLGALEMCIDLLNHEDELGPAMAHLHAQHVARHVPASYVTDFKEVLMTVLPGALGRCFDADAWDSCLDIILDGVFGARGAH